MIIISITAILRGTIDKGTNINVVHLMLHSMLEAATQTIQYRKTVCDRPVSDLLNLYNRAVTDLCIICYGIKSVAHM